MSEPRCVCENPGARRTQICPVCSPKADTILSPRGEQTEAVRCFECETELVGPLCPECNPEIKAALSWSAPMDRGAVFDVIQDAILSCINGDAMAGSAAAKATDTILARAEAPSVVGADRLHLLDMVAIPRYALSDFLNNQPGWPDTARRYLNAPALAALSPQALGEAHGSSSPKSEDTHRAQETPVVEIRADRAGELPIFLDALEEWGCGDTLEQAKEILAFLNSTEGVSQWREGGA